MSIENKFLWVGCVVIVFLVLMVLTFLKKRNLTDFKRPLFWFLFFAVCGLVVFL